MTKALRQFLESEHANLVAALSGGSMLGKSNDSLIQNYSTVVGRLAQISAVLTLDLETLIELTTEETDNER